MEARALEALGRAVGPGGLTASEQLRTYQWAWLTGHRVVPQAVVLPTTTEQVAACVLVCHQAAVPFVARGAGTGLSGGALHVAEGIVIGLTRMRSVLAIDVASRRVPVQPGVTNLEVTEAVQKDQST